MPLRIYRCPLAIQQMPLGDSYRYPKVADYDTIATAVLSQDSNGAVVRVEATDEQYAVIDADPDCVVES